MKKQMKNIEKLPELILFLKEEVPKKGVLLFKRNEKYISISSSLLYNLISKVSAGILSIGLSKGDKIAILSENRPEWVIADMAILSIGAVVVPIYPTISDTQLINILNDAACKAIFISNEEMKKKIFTILDRTRLEYIFSFEEMIASKVISLNKLIDIGDKYIKEEGFKIEDSIKSVQEDELATIIYTSGTTGEPKGVMLSHRNILSNVKSADRLFSFDDKDISLSFLPLSHIFERMAGYYSLLYKKAAIAYAESLDNIAKNLREIKPTILIGVPRFYEKIMLKILQQVDKSSLIKKRLFYWAKDIGRRRFLYIKKNEKLFFGMKIKYYLAKFLVYNKILKILGGKVKLMVSGGAPLPSEVAEFFECLNMRIYEGYGLTEASPVVSVNAPGIYKLGTVGKPMPGVRVKINNDGEILVQGENVMIGYYNKPLETAEAIKDGWLHTGDIGFIDNEGFLVITDRKKDIIVLSTGKNISPLLIENTLKRSKFISEAVVFGDNKKYPIALLIPNFEECSSYAKLQGINFASKEELCQSLLIKNLISSEINKIQKDLSSYEKVKKFILIPDEFKISSEELTPTLKIRRNKIIQKYKGSIEALYEERME